MQRALLLVALFWIYTPVAAQDTVAVGRALANSALNVEIECPENYICLDSWYGWKIRVIETLQGPPISGKIKAAGMQHTDLNQSYFKSLRLFVLRPIVDPEEHARLQADYLLIGTSRVHETFCLPGKPEHYDVELKDTFVTNEGDGHEFCFTGEAVESESEDDV
ncbi:MAG: hypothetical protein AAFO81_15370 [Pseudomonadota bacterium]